jgi:tetratricopeptide (TPR) repeat protein
MVAGLLLGLFLFAQPGPSAHEEDWKACRDVSPDARIKGCTAIILAGDVNPRDLSVAYHSRANANREKRLFDLALQDYDEAIKLNPKFVDALGDRAITLIVVRRFAEAIPDFTQVIELDPKSTYAQYDRGLAYEGLGLDDLAIEDFSGAIEQDPRDARRFERRGTVYFRKGDYDRALSDYEQALVVDPQYPAALYGRGIVKRIKGDAAGGGADVASAKHFQSDIDREMLRAGVKEK